MTQSSLAVTPRTNPLGKCEVALQGKITTNVEFADVTLAYRSHKGVTTPPREVTTGANREATFSVGRGVPFQSSATPYDFTSAGRP